MQSKTDNQIEAEAAEWILQLSEGDLSDEKLQAWQVWMEACPQHRRVYEKMTSLWNLSDELQAFDVSVKPAVQSTARRSWWGGALSAILPGPRLTFTTAVLLLISGIAYIAIPTGSTNKVAVQAGIAYQTAIGEHKTISLPDGSTIELGALSQVRVLYSGTARQINLLQGESLFQVAPDSSRPFTVNAGAGAYQALGTVFNVHLGTERSTLTVIEGVVQARLVDVAASPGAGNRPPLIAGEAVSVSNRGEIGAVMPVDPRSATAWRTGLLSFVDTPLVDVVADLNRYTPKQINIVDPSVGALRYTGSVSQAGIAEVLKLLPEVFPVRVTEFGGNIYIAALTVEKK